MAKKTAPKGRKKPPPRFVWTKRLVKLVVLMLVLTLLPVTTLRFVAPHTSAFMLARQWQASTQQDTEFRIWYWWMDWEDLGSHIPAMAVAAEDQKFPEHFGFDVQSIKSAVAEARAGGRLRGASTISQQVAKNLFLWSGQSWLRKGLEAYFTLAIEVLWSKRRILEVYLNIAEFEDGVYGVGAAARRIFNKSPGELTREEAALLAAVLPAPKRYSARNPGSYELERAAWIQQQARQLGTSHLRSLNVSDR